MRHEPTKSFTYAARNVNDFGASLRTLRRARKVTQQALADSAGITRRTLVSLEQDGGNAGSLVKVLAVLGHEVFPPAANPMQHVATLAGCRVRKTQAPWTTPRFVIEAVLSGLGVSRFSLDVASPEPPHVPCERHYTELDDGLVQEWFGDVVWVNPPYHSIPGWTDKLLTEFNTGRALKIVALLPFTPDTSAFQRIDDSGAGIITIRGRLRFGDRDQGAPFPSVLCTWGVSRNEIDAIAAALGKARIWSYGHAVTG